MVEGAVLMVMSVVDRTEFGFEIVQVQLLNNRIWIGLINVGNALSLEVAAGVSIRIKEIHPFVWRS